jgi:hypothetical protein
MQDLPNGGELLEDKLYLSVRHARRRAIETMYSSIVLREYLICGLFFVSLN